MKNDWGLPIIDMSGAVITEEHDTLTTMYMDPIVATDTPSSPSQASQSGKQNLHAAM